MRAKISQPVGENFPGREIRCVGENFPNWEIWHAGENQDYDTLDSSTSLYTSTINEQH